jgi:K+-sensing histidine kinase KdpD
MATLAEQLAQETASPSISASPATLSLEAQNRAMRRLVTAVQELSLARSLDAVTAVVRRAARELTGSDGATFVLRDGDKCYYVDEDAIGPLWKGQRFPLETCVSGWAMLNKRPAIIEDIYNDPRVPIDAYRPTFVKSLVMVPIRSESPIGAIGNYWAHRHTITPEEVELIQALANTTSVAMENIEVYSELERRVELRTRELTVANKELEAFSYSVSHDLRAPLRSVDGFSLMLLEDCGDKLDENGKHQLSRIRASVGRMSQLIEDLLKLSRVARTETRTEFVNVSEIASSVAATLKESEPGRNVEFAIEEKLFAQADSRLLRGALENLLGNAWKYTSKHPQARIEFGRATDERKAFFVRDDGAGFDPQYAEKLFAPFQRLHAPTEFPGTGIGLATVQRIIRKHGGEIWAEAALEKGATFYFTLA